MFPHMAHSTLQQQQPASCPQQPRSRAIATMYESYNTRLTPPTSEDFRFYRVAQSNFVVGTVQVSNLNACATALALVSASVAPALGALVPVRLSCTVHLGQPGVLEDCSQRLSVSTDAV